MASQSALSVIIPTCNRPSEVRLGVTALLAEMHAHDLGSRVEIVLVDDASDVDGTRDVSIRVNSTEHASAERWFSAASYAVANEVYRDDFAGFAYPMRGTRHEPSFR